MPSVPDGWFEFTNSSGSTIPARGIFAVTGSAIVASGRIALTAVTPSWFGDIGTCFVNGNMPVAANKYGICTRFGKNGGPVPILYDSSSDPGASPTWGPVPGSFKLWPKSQGWACVSPPLNTTLTTALFIPTPITQLRGIVTSGDVAAGATCTVEIYQRLTTTSYSDSTYSITALNDLGQTVTNGSVVRMVPEMYITGGATSVTWAIIQSWC